MLSGELWFDIKKRWEKRRKTKAIKVVPVS